MDISSQEYYLQWIIADHTPFRFNEREYFLSTPSREARFQAERIYMMFIGQAEEAGLYRDDEILKLLRKYNLWDDSKEQSLIALNKDIEEIKLNIFENFNNTGRRRDYKKALKDTTLWAEKLLSEKSVFDQYSCKYVANFAKQHFLMGSSIFRRRGKPALGQFWSRRDDDIIQYCYKVLSEYILSEGDYRLLARSANWRNFCLGKYSASALFGRPLVDLSFQQRQLIMWTSLYDSVYKNSECPDEKVIDDDDALDGWMIYQKRKRLKERNQDIIENSLTNDKIRNSDQIFVMCDPTISEKVIVDDPSKVYDCNDFEGRLRLQRIVSQVQKEGCVGLMGLKDTHSEIYRRAAELRST